MIISLVTGILSIISAYLILRKITKLAEKLLGLLIAVICLAIYFPFAFIYSHSIDVMAIHIALYMITSYGITIVVSSSQQTNTVTTKSTGLHWAPVSIVVFFILLLIVDTFFVTIAEKGITDGLLNIFLPESRNTGGSTYNYPGKVVHDYRQKGELYNNYIKRLETQSKHGWKIKKGWVETPVENTLAIFKVQILDKNNLPITNANITGLFIRYSNSQLDQSFEMKNVADGFYTAELSLPRPGKWGLVLKIQAGSIFYELNGNTTVKKHVQQ